MKFSGIFAAIAVLAAVGAGVAIGLTGGGCGRDACTPDNFDLGSASPLTVRHLEGSPKRDGTCARAGLEVVSTQADLEKLYADLGFAPDGGVSVGGVDFSRERVIHRQGVYGEGISWAVSQGDAVVVGLLACKTVETAPTCYDELVVVAALPARVETRQCESVGCSSPI